ncbi:hypothetical protein MLD38_027732 [Melastoma candidum]|uniref:Uncharacterized protein n=1 Tax=Melastoma candidum TaxID=119954 RepID=A0ACB9P732_9MYRT|nr:hypothetical protein MLD38_027732 [Melastoma candidum]
MKALTPLRLQLQPPSSPLLRSACLGNLWPACCIRLRKQLRPPAPVAGPRVVPLSAPRPSQKKPSEKVPADKDERSRMVVVGLASLGVMMLLLMGVDEHRALAFGPEGPLVEEFWDNVRRYALYALTVSTGALYTVLLPVLELLKNPITAILVLLIIAGSVYVLSQVLSAMVGVTEFSYDYGY